MKVIARGLEVTNTGTHMWEADTVVEQNNLLQFKGHHVM